MKKGFISMIGLAQIFLFAQNLNAQTTLDPVTVTSSLSEKRTSETGRNITIVKGEDILKLPVHSLDELLKYIPGVEIQSRGPQGSQSDISIRGGTYQQVLVILDGLRVNDPNSGHFSSYIPIAPAQIDRIEVLKGAAAAVYGSDAVGGVINIITKSANASHQTNKKIINAQVGAGEYNLINTNVGGFFQTGKLSVDAGLLSNHSTGVQQRGIKGYFHNTSASAGLNYKINDYWSLSARTAYDNRDFAAQNFYTSYVSDTATEQVKSWWHQIKMDYEKNKSKLSWTAGYKQLKDEYAFNYSGSANQSTSKLFQSLLLFQQQLAEQTTLITGFNYQNRAIVSNDRGIHSLHIAAPFVSLSQNIGSRFYVQPSLRAEFIANNKAELLPQLNASFHIGDFQLRASGGRTIRAAEFTELYNNYGREKGKLVGPSIGNPWLLPEVAWTYEAGFDWYSRSWFRLSSTFFQRFHSNLIDWVSTPYEDMPRKDNLNPSTNYALATNVATVDITGFETDVQVIAPIGKEQRLALNGGLVWLYSKSSQENPSFYISSSAKFLSNFSAIYNFGNAMISVTGVYKNRKARETQGSSAFAAAHLSKDYFLLNGSASYNFIKNRLGVFVQVDNIFDRTYSDLLGSPMPGRWLQGGLRFSLVK